MFLSLTTHNRLDVLKNSIESLLKTDFPPDSNLLVSDDASEQNVQKFLIDVFNSPVKNLSVKIAFNKPNVGCDMNMVRNIRECFSSGDQFVISIDSDAIYNPKWIYKLLWARDQIKENIGMLGVFDTHNHTVIGNYNDDIFVKSSLGGFAVMLNKDVFSKLENIQSWDWSYVGLCNQMKYRMFCTKKSYVEHIGLIGIHSMQGSVDKAKNFIAEGD